MKILLDKKANQSDLQNIADSKTNKQDSEQQLRAIDILHRQLDHTVVLLIEIIKGQLNEQNETMAGTKTNRLYLLKQCANISKWIREFDPQNINYGSLKLPTSLKQLNDHAQSLIKEWPQIDLTAEFIYNK